MGVRLAAVPAPAAAPRYELRVRRLALAASRYEIWQLPASATPQLTAPLRVAGLRGRNLELVEHRVLLRLSRVGIRLAAASGGGMRRHPLGEDLALTLGLLFRALAPMRSREAMRAVADGIEAMGARGGRLLARDGDAPPASPTGLDRAPGAAHRATAAEVRRVAVKLEAVEIRNFRAIEELELRLDPQLTVLHGENARGKTSVLRAIAVGLGAIPKRLPGVSGVDFSKSDRRLDAGPASVHLTAVGGGSWRRRRGSGGQPAPGPGASRWLNEHLDRIAAADREGTPLPLPIVALYDTDRTALDVPQRRRGFAREFPRYGALQGALAARANFRELFQWFYFHENEELREQKERRDFDYQLPELRAVRTAICSALSDVSEPRIRLRPLRFEVSLKTADRAEQLDLGRLSGGYRAVLALVMDLARRMAQGNPQYGNPLQSEAIVLIDEVDLHLHPSWQQRILGDLTRTFPNAQFIVSTHSPQVLTTVKPEQVVSLRLEDGRLAARAPDWGTWGAEAGDVLTVVMGVKERPVNEFSETLTRYRRLVAQGDGEGEEAGRLRAMLDGIAPGDPALARADLEIRQRKLFHTLANAR